MKKLAFMLVLMIALVPFHVFAEENQFSQEYVHSYFSEFSTEELLALQKAIGVELEYRGYSSEKTETKEFDVPVGKYTIGVDIPAGTYTVSRGNGMFDSLVVIGNYETFYPVSQNSPIGKLELVEGQTIEVQMGGVKFSEYKGLGF